MDGVKFDMFKKYINEVFEVIYSSQIVVKLINVFLLLFQPWYEFFRTHLQI